MSGVSILRFLGLGGDERSSAAGSSDTETVRRIVAELEGLEPERARFVATFAAILSRVARADLDVSADETATMERLVAERGRLPEAQAVLVVQMAKTQNLLLGATENYLVTREFDRTASRDEKLALIDCLYAVSAADGSVTTVEDNVIRQVADELKLDRADRIAVRARYRDSLAVLQDDDDGPAAGA